MVNVPEVHLPDLEVIVNASAFNVAVISFFARGDIHDGFEVVGAIHDTNELKAIREILQEAIKFLSTNDWVTLDELDAWQDAEEGDPPF